MKAVGLLCDHAQVADNKLFVSGAAVNRVFTLVAEPPLRVTVALAILVTIPWNATNQPHRLAVELVADDGTGARRVPLTDMAPADVDPQDYGMIIADFNAGRSPTMRPGEDTLMPVALPMHPLVLPQPGAYFFSIKIDGEDVDRISFHAEVAAPSFTLRAGV